MDLKRKFKSLLHRQDSPRSPVEEEVTAAAITNDPAVTKFKEHVNEYRNDPHADREVIESIEQDYYGETFDASRYELLKLSEVLDLTQIDADRMRLRRQLQVVSKKVSDVVLANQAAYETELQRVMELQQSLQYAGIICTEGRGRLYQSRQKFTTASLALLANYRKRQQLNMLLKSLRTIKTLQRTEIRLREMLEEEDFAGAIQLCLECQKAASTFRHYTCISELSSKLQDTLEMIEEQLDVALSKTCIHFDTEHYSKVQTAYRMLSKTQTAMDQLHMHYASAIHNSAFTIVLGYVELCSGAKTSNFQKRQYADLCRSVENDAFIPCLIDLCKALWEVMKSYQMTIEWHEKYDMGTSVATGNSSDADSGASQVEATLNRRYIKQKLEHGLGRIWQDVQQKVKTYILATDLSGFKFDGFIQVLDLVNRLIMIGEEFCSSRSESLQDSLKQQSLNYFKNYHRSRMEELRMFLENESWELCPVKSNFTQLQLLEFRFLRNWTESNRPGANIIPSSSSNSSIQTSGERPPEDSAKPNHGYFDKYGDDGNPFDIQKTDDEKEDVLANGMDDSNQSQAQDSDSDSDIPDELKQDYIDELTGEAPSKRTRRQSSREKRRWKTAPIITNTTLNVLRVIDPLNVIATCEATICDVKIVRQKMLCNALLNAMQCGKYLQMMTFLKPIAFDVTLLMSQLFDYYLYAVYTFFGLDMPELTELTLNNRLKITIQRIQESLIAEEQGISGGFQDDKPQVDRIPPPHLSPVVDFSEQKLYGLSERIVAAESLVFLACQFDQLQPHLENMIPTNKKAFLQQFYSQTVNMAKELRKPIYGVVSARAIDYDQLLQLMGLVRWDVREIMSQHNSYVDVVLKEFMDFQKRLSEIGRHMPVPKPVHDTLWEQCIRIANRSFVEGYTCAKKCSNEGRALMQLDFQQYITKLEKLTDIRPVPDREFVENYIKAYYLPEAQLEQWIKDHKEYTSKQLSALVNCVDHVNKKARQRLTTLIEEMERPRR